MVPSHPETNRRLCPQDAEGTGPRSCRLAPASISGSLPSLSHRPCRLRSRDPPAAMEPLTTSLTDVGAPIDNVTQHGEGAHAMITMSQPMSATPMHVLAPCSDMWPL